MADAPRPQTDLLTPSSASRAPLRAKLVVASGPDFGRELVLERGVFRIGKDPNGELVLTDGAVSRLHLKVEVLLGSIRLIDAGSKNGSFCDGKRFTTLEVQPGVVIRVGHTELKLVPVTAAAAALPPSERESFGGLSGKSLAMRELFALLERVSAADADVLIHGETGTGKEVCARAIHDASPRRKGPFVVCDLAAITASLMESELFGHVRGAFTHAVADHAGYFERADGGTLFLDEVGELSFEAQARLLGVLERRQVQRVGASAAVPVDVRVVAATHRDLEARVSQGQFREDLLHRLAVVRLELPSLRERREDVPVLIDRFLDELGQKPSHLSAETRALLAAHAWPGNVRELRNVIESAVSLGGQVQLPDADPTAKVKPKKGSVTADIPFKQAKDLLVEAFEKDYLVDLMKRSKGNLSQAARTAGIDRAYLYRLLGKHGL